MTYPVILGKGRKQLESVLGLPELAAEAATYLAVYGKRGEQHHHGHNAILMKQGNGKWALLCCAFVRPLREVKPTAKALSSGVSVVFHQEFAARKDWARILQERYD